MRFIVRSSFVYALIVLWVYMVSGLSEAQAAVTYQITADASPATILPGRLCRSAAPRQPVRTNPLQHPVRAQARYRHCDATELSRHQFCGRSGCEREFQLDGTHDQPVLWHLYAGGAGLNAKGSGVGHNTDTFQLIRPPVNGMCGSSGGAT